MDYGQIAASFAPALTTLLTSASSIDDIERRGDAAIAGIEQAGTELVLQEDIIRQQSNDIERAVGDTLTSRNLQALKDFSRAKAIQVETGGSGRTAEQVVQSIWMTSSLDNANTIKQGRKAKVDLERRSSVNKLSFNNKVSNIQASMLDSTSAALSTGSAAVSGFTTGYSMLPNYQRENYFKF